METKLFKSHRYLKRIENGIKKGFSSFYLYGKGLDDYTLFNTHLGVKNLQETLLLYFYNIQKIDAFIYIKDKNIKAINKDGQIVSLREMFNQKTIKSGFGANKTKLTEEINSKLDIQANKTKEMTTSSAFDNNFKMILQHMDTKKIVVYFDEFEWQTKLYSGNPDLELLQKLKSLLNSKSSFVILNIKQPKLLEKFGFDIDESNENMIYIGNPSQLEIANSYRRFIYQNYPLIRIKEEDFDDIIVSIKSSNKSLREAIRSLKFILSKIPKNAYLTKNLFEEVISLKIEEKVVFDDVILDDKTKNNIIDKIETFKKNRDISTKGLILYGPSGTGKTLIAKAVANEYKMNFLAPTLADLKGEYVGHTSGRIKRLFEEARANAPTVLFLDEIDTIFPNRGGENTDSYLRDMVNQFLVEIDGVSSGQQEIFIIAATNRLEVIDSAITSRLSDEIKIGLPNEINREIIFDKGFKSFKLSKQNWKKEFLSRTEGMSGRDIENFIKEVKILEIPENKLDELIFNRVLSKTEQKLIEAFKREMKGNIEISDKIEITFDDVVGYEEVKMALNDELRYMLSSKKEKMKMKQFHIKPKRGHLLYGPPGNGKTTFAQALAGENNFYFIKVLSKDFIGYSPVDILNQLDSIFNNVIRLSKMTDKKGIVLFFDEVDTLISNEMDKNVRGTLLSYLEDKKGIKSETSKVILIAATNFKNKLDEASIREGRFDNKLEIYNPSKEKAIQMLKQFINKDTQLDIKVKENFYEFLYNYLYQKKQRENISNNSNSISIVELETLKNQLKSLAFYNDKILDGKIIIEDDLLNNFKY